MQSCKSCREHEFTDLLLFGTYCLCIDIRTFEVLLRTYEVREVKMGHSSCGPDNGSPRLPPYKRRQRSEANYNEDDSSSAIMAKPSGEARGHTGYLTFARRK